MQLSQIYSNLDKVFSPIDFNCGEHSDILNVVFATVRKKKQRDGDSHNLGKTTLIHLIDFLLLKDVSGGASFLTKHAERFSNFVFYIEIKLHFGGYVTVRRTVAEPSKASFKRADVGVQDFRQLPQDHWDHWEVGLDSARTILDSYLDLRMIAPWGYRKGVSYFLRTQEDYFDYFQIQKFVQGKDREWKPYLAGILGLDHEAVHQKYLLDEQIDEDTKLRDERKSEIALDNQDRGELATRIDIARDEIGQIDARLDDFDFTEEERRISKRVVENLEARISDLNEDLYDLDSDIAELERSIARGLKFDLERIEEIFTESKVALPDAVTRSYTDLVDFNRRLTRERNSALRAQIKELSEKRDKLAAEHGRLSSERQHLMQIVKDADTFRKYKALQKEQSERRAALVYLETQLAKLDVVQKLDQRLRDHRKKRDDYITAVEVSLQQGSPVKTAITQLFNRYVMQILNIHGEFIVTKNRQGNLDFEIKTKDALGIDTSQDQGHSYRRLLCALFDLAVLKALENVPFYHFVYHDGILEGLDNKLKLRFLDLVRGAISTAKLQYILSVIDSDLPRDLETDRQITFSPDEIILTLHDDGDDGRLFKMPSF